MSNLGYFHYMLRNFRRASTFAVACPGQGILPRGCLLPFAKHQPLFQKSLDSVDEALGEQFSKYLLEPSGSDSWSLSTSNAQPAIVTSTYVIKELFRDLYGVDLAKDSRVSHLLGHSLGEYTALLLGGALTLPQAVQIVRKRGLLMEELVKGEEFAMVVLVFKPTSFDSVLEIAQKYRVLACVNNQTQILISGDPGTLKAALTEMNTPKKTILKLVKLPVTIPFHNEVLSCIEADLNALLTAKGTSSKPIVSNCRGELSSDLFSTTVLANSQPVQWKKSMEYIIGEGVTDMVNLGPGNAVGAINSRFEVRNHAVGNLEDMEKLAFSMKESV